MRILKVRFQNLNSLAGKWEIDFTNPRYVNDGIFAIVGSTGAGKSTLMDAICLALYGRTPRLKSINASGNEIMTTNTGVCYSEVEFSTQKGIFRSTWSQRRSREKADGNLQPQQMEVAGIGAGEEKILTEKIGDSLLKIEEVTGMDYDRFVQSMMLAQGAFAQFLKATPKERSPILEEITGKQIYTELSVKAHERSSQEFRELKSLTDQSAAIPRLKEDEKQELEQTLAFQYAQLAARNEVLQQLSLFKNWLLLVEQLQQQLEQLEQSTAAAAQQQAHFRPQLLRLERAELAAQLDAEYTIFTLKSAHKQTLTKQIEELESLIPELHAVFNERSEALELARNCLNASKLTFAESQSRFRQVRLLDAELTSQYARIEEERKKEEEFAGSIGILRQEIAALQQESDVLQTRQASAQKYLAEHAGDKQIQNTLGAVELYYQQSIKMNEERARQEQLHQRLMQQHSQLRQTEPVLTGQLRAAQRRLGELQQQVAGRTAALTATTGGREEAEIRRELQLLQEKRLLVSKIRSLEAERTRLHDGQPCPLCGSEHHPYAEGNLPTDDEEVLRIDALHTLLNRISEFNSEIRRLQQEQLQAGAEVASAEKALELHALNSLELQKRLHELDTSQTALQTEYEGLKKKITALISPFGFPEWIPETSGEVVNALIARGALWEKAIARISESELQLNQVRNGLASRQSALELRQHQQTELQEALQMKLSKFSGLKAERSELFGDKRVDDEEARIQNEVQQAEQRWEKAQQAATEAERLYRQAVQRLKDASVQYSEVDKELSAATGDLLQKLRQSQFVDIDDLVHSRIDRVEMQQLQAQRRQLQTELERLETLLTETRKRLDAEKAKRLTEETLESLSERELLLKQEVEVATEAMVQVRSRLDQDEQNRRQLGDLLHRIEKQRLISTRWAKLNQLIGSADGSVFNKYAQGLTFEIVLNYANIQLQKLTDRYIMRRDPNEALAIQVVDTYQNNRVRSTDNLSGGESFLFSLALALGLAQISSRNIKIETLFLDEGFGTLDEDTLEIALDALNSLHQEGRLIGIISHVAGLKESINTQIIVEKGVMGRSTLKGPGVRQLNIRS